MNNHTPGTWRYFKNDDGTFSVIAVGNVNFEAGFATNLIAKVFSEGIIDPEANARLIASASEIYQGLVYAVEALKATRDFLRSQGLSTAEIDEILTVAEGLIKRVEGE